MKKILAVLLLCATTLVFAQSGSIPASAFASPSADDKAQNPSYWQGYAQGEGVAGAILPSPTCATPSYQSYKAVFQALYKPQATGFFPINQNVGYDNALEDGANWLWLNASGSPFRTVCP
jgi:hypothetical protein